jgi:hypothetical protein
MKTYKCIFCGQAAKHHQNHIGSRYTCHENLTDCPEYLRYTNHLRTCSICREIYENLPLKFKYHHKWYKSCYTFRYLVKKIRGLESIPLKHKAMVQRGKARCYMCGQKANFYTTSGHMCCSESSRDCPEYNKTISDRMKLKYKLKPELLQYMSETMKVVQNKEKVRRAKKLKMLHLHNDDCDECKEFQQKFKQAHKERRTENYKFWKSRS